MGFHYRRRYSLPPNDPRWLDATEYDIAVDVWAHKFADDPRLYDEQENDSFAEDLAAMEAEAGVPAWEDDDTRGGVTASKRQDQEPDSDAPPSWADADDPDAWDDLVNDRSPA